LKSRTTPGRHYRQGGVARNTKSRNSGGTLRTACGEGAPVKDSKKRKIHIRDLLTQISNIDLKLYLVAGQDGLDKPITGS